MSRHHSFAIPFSVCCAGVALFAVMDAAMKGLSLGIGLYNALFWRAIAGTPVSYTHLTLPTICSV